MTKYEIKLLIVEDDNVIRSIYQRVLQNTVANILVAENGEEGYNIFLKENPDLILTDIKMPIMNGLDMINKIREENKAVRILIMSAYGESRYFINAIESGVKGFLTKPIKNEDLKKAVVEQASDILLEKNLVEAELKRRTAENEKEKSDKILNSLSEITATIFQQGLNDASIEFGLKQIGEATQSTRVVIIKFETENGNRNAQILNIWRANNESKEYVKLPNNEIGLQTPMLEGWHKLMKSNKIVGGNVSNFDPQMKSLFEMLGSKSISIMPIFVNEDLWGGLVLENSLTEHVISENEAKAMKMVAYNFGAALYRKSVERELINMNLNLEKRVKERTNELEIEVFERSNAQALLRESEEKYRLIYENASNGILLIQNETILLTNPTMVVLMELMPRELIGHKFYNFIKSSNKKDIRKFFKSDKMHMTESSFEIMISTQSEKERWLDIKVNGIEWDDEPGFLVFASDVTLKKSAQLKLNDLNKNLEKKISQEISRVKQQHQLLIQKTKLESLGELSASLAHEINQPLGGISMGLENIIFKMSQNELSDDYLNSKVNVLFSDITRIKQIIEHVRTFSRDQQNAEVKLLSIDKVAKNAVSLIKRQYANHEVDLIIEIPNDTYYTLGNPFRLEQVFLNILSNAKAAVDEKFEQNYKDYKKRIKLSMEKDDEYIFINISDNGIGMPIEVMDKIFEPFFTTKDQQSGTGLGLSISYGIIKEMNGEIRVESDPNSCTKLTVELPITKS